VGVVRWLGGALRRGGTPDDPPARSAALVELVGKRRYILGIVTTQQPGPRRDPTTFVIQQVRVRQREPARDGYRMH
jgi:hypothetical protein